MKDLIQSRGHQPRRLPSSSWWRTMLLMLVLCVGFNANAQNITVTGTVEDNTGDPLIGAAVTLDGSKSKAV